jgi:hypothetical protein
MSRRAHEEIVGHHRELVEAAREEIVHLRQRNDALTDQLTRVMRKEAGLPEVPREPRRQLQPMPADIREYTEGFFTSSIRKAERDQLYKRHAAGETWPEIRRKVLPQEQEEVARDG